MARPSGEVRTDGEGILRNQSVLAQARKPRAACSPPHRVACGQLFPLLCSPHPVSHLRLERDRVSGPTLGPRHRQRCHGMLRTLDPRHSGGKNRLVAPRGQGPPLPFSCVTVPTRTTALGPRQIGSRACRRTDPQLAATSIFVHCLRQQARSRAEHAVQPLSLAHMAQAGMWADRATS